ncbi:MAG: helix-turn-helix domain-containing protein [Rhodocyclaceae bacterium]|nr:helix-turn-helix domain-containing protein [Rhodocyclaceae bacterium]
MNIKQAAQVLGVSGRMVYTLAAPAGPIPCHRIGRRIIFDPSDVQEFKTSCRSIATKREVVSSLNSTRSSMAKESELLKAFRALGIKPKLTVTTGKNPAGSTPSQPVSNARSSPLMMQSPST